MANLLKLSQKARDNLKYEIPLEPDSEQFVDLNKARKEFNEESFLWELGIASADAPFEGNIESQYILFGGHRGCGKSTELRRLARELHREDRYFVIFIDVLDELDVNDISYSDILLAQAKVLTEQLEKQKINIEQVFLTRLENWFKETIKIHEEAKELGAGIETGAEAKSGLPFIGSMFAKLTGYIRNNTTYKTEVRNVLRNSFTEFAEIFNSLLQHVEEQLKEAQKGRKLIFIVDGTDRLSREDSHNFFIQDSFQLQLVRSNFIYCAPISLISESSSLTQEFKVVRLPMLKIAEKGVANLEEEACNLLRKLIYLRVDKTLFDDEDVVNYLIRYSGGHVRDLIRLLSYSLGETLGRKKIDRPIVEQAVERLATEYRRLIEQEDYELLVEIDERDKNFVPNSDQTKRLLYDLILLEYNRYWWQTHPTVTTLSAYKKVKETKAGN